MLAETKEALALVDELRKRGAVSVSVPMSVRLSDGGCTAGALQATFSGPLVTALPAPAEPEEQVEAHRDAPDCGCRECRVAFGSAD